MDDRAGRCDALSAVAEMMLDSGRAPEDAAVPLDQARRIADRLGSHYEIARERIVRAKLEELAGETERAVKAASEALESAIAENLVFYELHARARLAVLAVEDETTRKQTKLVLEKLDQGINVEHVDQLYRLVAKALRNVGDEETAIRCEEAARDAIDTQAAAIRSAPMRARFLAARGRV